MIRNILKIILGMTNPYKRNEKRVYKDRQRAVQYIKQMAYQDNKK